MEMRLLQFVRASYLTLPFLQKFYQKCSVVNKKKCLIWLSFVSGMSFTSMTNALSESGFRVDDIEIRPSVYNRLILSKREVTASIDYPGLRKGSVCGVTLVVEDSNDGHDDAYLNALELFSEDLEVYEFYTTLVKRTIFIEKGYHKDINYIFKTMSGAYVGHVTFKTKSGKTLGESWNEALSRQIKVGSPPHIGLIPVLCKLGGEETGWGDSVSVLD